MTAFGRRYGAARYELWVSQVLAFTRILNPESGPLSLQHLTAPPLQACEWLRKHLTSRMPSVDTTTMQDPRFGNTLELAVRFGKTLIIQVWGVDSRVWGVTGCGVWTEFRAD